MCDTMIPNKNDDKSRFDVMEVNWILSIIWAQSSQSSAVLEFPHALYRNLYDTI